MRVYHFTEQPYPFAWNDPHGYLRVDLPNRALDPKIAADLFHRYYDEWMLADELGLDIMLNEHHQTATCMSSTSVVGLSILARITKRARLLVLGYPIGDHQVVFAGAGERLELTHRATSRVVYAKGAVQAARWVVGRPPGLYGLKEVLGL